MMKRYRLTPNGVYEPATNKDIPNAIGNSDWREYLDWVAEGNTPDPIPDLTKDELLNKLRYNFKTFVETEPNGWTRYDNDLKLNILTARTKAGLGKANNPKECSDFDTWYKAILAEYFALRNDIEEGNSEVNISYEMFESKFGRSGTVLPDPHITTTSLVAKGLL